MLTIKKLLICFFAFLGAGSAFAQRIIEKKIVVKAEALYSTHRTTFAGGSIAWVAQLNKNFSLGAGVEHAYCRYHDDNAMNLYHLNFTPVYISEYLQLRAKPAIQPYLHLQQGISFIKYTKEYMRETGKKYRVHEKGFYGAAAAGAKYTITPKASVLIEAGIKAYHISANEWDINPHGIMGRLGMAYNL